MESVDDDLLDIGDVECAWSEGGDSLLDSEEECEGSGERGCGVEKIGESKEERSGKLSLQSSLSSGPPAPASPPPQSTPPPDDAITSPKKSRVIRLDSKRKFRYVSDSLPDVPLPKRTMSRKKPVITRPRRITKPSLLLEPRKMFPSEPNSDLRNILVAHRMTQLESRKADMTKISGGTDSGSLSVGTGTAGLCVGTGTAGLCDGTHPQRDSVDRLHTATASNPLFTTKRVPPPLFPSPPQRVALTESFNNGVSSFGMAPTAPLSNTRLPTSHGTPLSFTATLFSKPDHQHRTALATDNSSNVQRRLFAGGSEAGTQPASLFKTTPVLGQHSLWLHGSSRLSTSQPCHSPLTTTLPQASGEVRSINPFYAKMQELPQKSSPPDEEYNPFLTALQKEVVINPHQNAISSLTSSPPSSQKFSFSLAQLT